MRTLKFKTNINCEGCIAAIAPYLNSVENIDHWEVDTKDPDKILRIYGEHTSEKGVVSKVKEAGYSISIIE